MTAAVSPFPGFYTEDIPEGAVSTHELIHRSGITYRQADYWMRTGLITPVQRRAGATSGTPLLYPVDQVHKAATIRWLLDAGLNLAVCRDVIDELLETGQARLTDGLVIHLPEEA